MSSRYWSIHTHSIFSAKDGMTPVAEHVARAEALGYPALAMTDHGTIASSPQLYVHCREAGIEPLPGMEAYFTWARHIGKGGPASAHMGLVAVTETGFRNLVRLNNVANERFRRRAFIDITDLYEAHDAGALEGLVCTTGCYFGVLSKAIKAGGRAARNVLEVLSRLFGTNLYVELQHHGIYPESSGKSDGHDDDELNAVMFDLASQAGLPVVLGGDSHYVLDTHKPYHDVMKQLGSWSDDPDDAAFPGLEPYALGTEATFRRYMEPALVDAGLVGLDDILGKAKVVIPELESFRMKVPELNYVHPDDELRDRAREGLARHVEHSNRARRAQKSYFARLEEELTVIIDGGFSSYMLLVSDMCRWMATMGLTFGVRGSAAGSLVAFCIGITSFDPVPWKLDFARFLSTDRTKPPDIDIDVADDERDAVISYLSDQFVTRSIGTWSTMSVWEDNMGTLKGSLPNDLHRYKRKTGKMQVVTEAEREALFGIASLGVMANQSRHAAGVLVASAEDISNVPLRWMPASKSFVTAYDKDDLEMMGYTKVDVLGLKLLTALRMAAQTSGVPLGEAETSTPQIWRAVAQGKTAGMFQLSGFTMRRGCKRMRPRSVLDLQVAMALFRPAIPEEIKDSYLARRAKTESVPAAHPVIENNTADTYGIFLFQEQLIAVLRDLGMDADELTVVLKAVKSSNKATVKAKAAMESALTRVNELMADAGITDPSDVSRIHDAMRGYGEYGFNRAHATSYAYMAALSAYYAVHHPTDFWAGMMTAHDGDSTSNDLFFAAKDAGVSFIAPHVNYSRQGYVIDNAREGIRMPLTTIPGIGTATSNEIVAHSPYRDLIDLADRTSARLVTGTRAMMSGHSLKASGGAITALYEAGALEGLR